MTNQQPEGLLLGVYKPKGPTSHDVIAQIRKITGEQRVGHCGTLDPLADGVLVVGIGRGATKRLWDPGNDEKEYETDILLGIASTTGDEQGEKTEVTPDHIPSRGEVEAAVARFVGHIEQTPPQYSAIKVAGKPAYAYARAGKSVALQAREAHVKSIEIRAYAWPTLSLRVVTGKGVYIRTLAEDIARALGTAGYLTKLTRVRVGAYHITEAVTLDNLSDIYGRWRRSV